MRNRTGVTISMLTIITLSLVSFASTASADDTDKTPAVDPAPTRVVQKAIDKVLTVLQNPKHSDEEKREQVMSILDPLVDFPLMARLSLGKKTWRGLSATDRAAFTDLFVEELQQSYFDKITLFSDERVEYQAPVRLKMKGRPKYSVLTYIISKGERTQVSYALSQQNPTSTTPASGTQGTPAKKGADGKAASPKRASGTSKWRVYDIVIEGVSIRKSKGSDYRDFLKEHSFAELLATMKKKIADAKKKRQLRVRNQEGPDH